MVRRAVVVLGALLMGLTSARAQIDCAGPEPGPCSLLSYYKAVFVGTAGEYNKDSGARRFRVTEAFKGIRGDYVEVVELRSGFEPGRQYLVFASPCFWQDADKRCLYTQACSPPRPLEYAAAVLQQLRAEKSGMGVAPVYGTLVRTLKEDRGMREDGFPSPLPNVTVRLQSGGKSFETRTEANGAYAFRRLPPGKYQVSADLPPNLVLGQPILGDPPEPFDLPRRSCFENFLYALPTGRISGRVIGPDGKPLRVATLDLYSASKYKDGTEGVLGFQGEPRRGIEWKPFQFPYLPADDYVLVFNSANREDPDQPFPRTFYPHASDLHSSQPIHLSGGQQILDADIRVSNPLPTRQVTIRLDWDAGTPQDTYGPQLFAKASRGREPYLFEDGRGGYTLNLLLSAQYAIHVESLCRFGGTVKVETNEVTIDGGDLSVSDVTLKFNKGRCAAQQAPPPTHIPLSHLPSQGSLSTTR
jgi:hypothetical protein